MNLSSIFDSNLKALPSCLESLWSLNQIVDIKNE